MTEQELLEALREAMESHPGDDAGAMTAAEITVQLGVSDKKCYKILRPLVTGGMVECISVPRHNLAGVVHPVPAYRLKPSPSLS
jgi:DNA-binding IclR family transcriptional regulator